MTQAGLAEIKSRLEGNIGKNVKVITNRGKKKCSTTIGVIESTYPSIFVIRVTDSLLNNETRKVSYSYTDILTRTVELSICK